MTQNCFIFGVIKEEKLVLICSKSESDIKEEIAHRKKKNQSHEKKREGHNKKLSDLKPSIFDVQFPQIIIYVQLSFMP